MQEQDSVFRRLAASESTRRNLLRGAGAVGAGAAATALLAACTPAAVTGSATGAAAAGGGPGNFPSTPKFKFVFINHVTTNPFFQGTQYGFQDAAALLNLPTPQWTGSETSNVAQMVTAFNTAITGKADGIAVSLIDAKAFEAPIKAATAAGIPVVSYNSDAPSLNIYLSRFRRRAREQ